MNSHIERRHINREKYNNEKLRKEKEENNKKNEKNQDKMIKEIYENLNQNFNVIEHNFIEKIEGKSRHLEESAMQNQNALIQNFMDILERNQKEHKYQNEKVFIINLYLKAIQLNNKEY